MGSDFVIEEVIRKLARRFGKARRSSKARVLTFGSAATCSINYSKLLHGNKYFFGLPSSILDLSTSFPKTDLGEFVLLICGSSESILVLPRAVVADAMRGVVSRRLDIFVEGGTYIFQTAGHPKCDVTEYLNAFPASPAIQPENLDDQGPDAPDRLHVRIQFALIALGQAEGCSVWAPTNDRNLAYRQQSFSARTVDRLPNFGFDVNTRRIVQNIDVLWLSRNVIRKAFEIESTTSIYSGLLRLNDLVLSQPNIQIDLYIASAQARRDKVCNQLMRPSFHPLLSKCEFVSFERISEQMERLETLPLQEGVRVSGLLRGERFSLPNHFLYPDQL
jgi:hypothetical protein